MSFWNLLHFYNINVYTETQNKFPSFRNFTPHSTQFKKYRKQFYSIRNAIWFILFLAWTTQGNISIGGGVVCMAEKGSLKLPLVDILSYLLGKEMGLWITNPEFNFHCVLCNIIRWLQSLGEGGRNHRSRATVVEELGCYKLGSELLL